VDGLDDEGDEQALEFVASERYEGTGRGVAGAFIGADDGEEGMGEHGQGEDRRIERQTRRVETSPHHRDLELGAHYFRGVGAGYVLRVASERGWNLHPVLRSHLRRRFRLRHIGRPRSDLRN
jgi:hypothetical protein